MQPKNTSRLAAHLPEYDYADRYERRIQHPANDRLLHAIRHLDFSASLSVRTLFILRGMPLRFCKMDAMLNGEEFTLIEEHPGQELVAAGIVSPRLRSVRMDDARDFREYAEPHGMKIAWNFYIEPDGPDAARVSTETRVQCLGPVMKRRFGIYWFFIRPFSGWIRLEMLRLLARSVEEPHPPREGLTSTNDNAA